MSVPKRIISCILIIATLVSIFAISAYADVADSFSYTTKKFLEFIDYAGHLPGETWKFSEWWTALTSGDDDSTAYSTYVSSVNSELGTTTLVTGGYRRFYTITNIVGTNTLTSKSSVPAQAFSFSNGSAVHVCLDVNALPVSTLYNYRFGYTGTLVNCYFTQYNTTLYSGAGSNIGWCNYTTVWLYNTSSGPMSANCQLYIDCTPASGSFTTTVNTSSSTRPTTLVSNNYVTYGYNDSSNVLHTAPSGTVIVDETNNQVYNPVTGETTAITNWVYDYSTRTYTVTTAAGGTITITYGDDAITWNDGANTYSILYVTGTDSSSTETTTSTDSSSDLNAINKWASDKSHSGDISGMNWNDFMYVFLNLYSNLRDHFQTAFPAFASTMNTDLEEIKNSLGFGNYASDDVTLKSLLQSMQTTLQSISTNTANTASNTSTIASNETSTATTSSGVYDPVPASSDGDSGFSILDLAKQLSKGAWKIVYGGVGIAFGSITGIINAISSLGDMNDAYDHSSAVYGFYNYTGADIWD